MALNWKDRGDHLSEAHAARAVGGKYRITRCVGTDMFNAPTGSVWFEVGYLVHQGNGQWHTHYRHSKEPIRTLAEAKHFAEQDHNNRLGKVREDVSRWPS
jgi:hypothetical protein